MESPFTATQHLVSLNSSGGTIAKSSGFLPIYGRTMGM